MLTQNYLQKKKQKKNKNNKIVNSQKTHKNKHLNIFIGETIELFMSLSKSSK